MQATDQTINERRQLPWHRGGLAGAAGVEIEWRPFLLGPIFSEQGWKDSPFNIYPAKGRYMWRDLARICDELGIPLRRPARFPQNTLLAARVACRFQTEDWLPEFVRQVYGANFARDGDISDRHLIASILQDLGQPAGSIDEAESIDAKTMLRNQTDEAKRIGVFGAPSFVVGDELFWGNDRLETAIAWAQRSA